MAETVVAFICCLFWATRSRLASGPALHLLLSLVQHPGHVLKVKQEIIVPLPQTTTTTTALLIFLDPFIQTNRNVVVDQNNSCRDVLDDRLIFSAFFTNAVPGSELLSANMFIGIILNQIFLDLGIQFCHLIYVVLPGSSISNLPPPAFLTEG